MYKVPADIPNDIAMAIYKVLHNQAGYEEWELFDKTGHKKVLDYVRRILLTNGNLTDEELEWWQTQLAVKSN